MRRFPEVTVSGNALIGLAIMILIAEIKWVMAFICSAAVHELFHAAALMLMRCTIHRISIGFTGTKIVTSPLSRKQEIISSLAGPVGGFLLTTLGSRFPRIALCAFFHSTINLLPFYPLDGGRVLRQILPIHLHKKTETVFAIFILLILIWQTGSFGISASLIFIVRRIAEKYLAKNRPSGYNIATIK
jgi:Zn-dependent protease